MSYFQFLALFLGLPILLLAVANYWGKRVDPPIWRNMALPRALLIVIILALLYTTPWDNYLVATGVWWYDPALVTGITIGWVPIEEYTFFILQPIMTGLWLTWLKRRLPTSSVTVESNRWRWRAAATAVILWLAATGLLFSGWQPGTYLGLELSWALLPIILQSAFGGDILWRNRRLILAGLLPTTVYLAAADAIAISAGTWTINPVQSLPWLIGNILPIEEFLFFLLTNTLVVFGLILFRSTESATRLQELSQYLQERGWLRLEREW